MSSDGALTTTLVGIVAERELTPTPLEATAFALGIHEDTGSLTYATTTQRDVDALSWCMRHGARQDLVNEYLHAPLAPAERGLLQALLEALEPVERGRRRAARRDLVARVRRRRLEPRAQDRRPHGRAGARRPRRDGRARVRRRAQPARADRRGSRRGGRSAAAGTRRQPPRSRARASRRHASASSPRLREARSDEPARARRHVDSGPRRRSPTRPCATR